MRRVFALFLALAIVISGTAVFAAQKLSENEAQIVYTENRVYGDICAADGLSVKRNLELRNHILWNSFIDFGRGAFLARTDIDFSSDVDLAVRRGSVNEYHSIDISNAFYWGFYSPGDFYHPDPDLDVFNSIDKALNELAEETQPGSTGSKTIRLADYADTYELDINLNLPDIYYSSNGIRWNGDVHYYAEEAKNDNMVKLNEFFRIPVIEDEYIDITLDKNYDGRIGGTGCGSSNQGDSYCMISHSAVSSDAAYIWFPNRTESGKTVDTSLIPGGYGIYILPYGMRTDGSIKKSDGSAAVYPDIFAEDLRVFYPVDTEDIICELSLSADMSQLILCRISGGRYTVDIIDAKSAELLQEFDLADYDTERSSAEFVLKEDFCVLCIDGCYYVISEGGGEWKLVLSTQAKGLELEDSFIPKVLMVKDYAFDGKKLAVCGENIIFDDTFYEGGEYPGCGFYAAVYGQDGLEYYGVFSSSLDDTIVGEDLFYGYNASSVRRNGIAAEWNGTDESLQ